MERSSIILQIKGRVMIQTAVKQEFRVGANFVDRSDDGFEHLRVRRGNRFPTVMKS
jgi:hypothetical protein